ncbi:hypothetical protein Scep_024004 [Stephania cephalantha]|uniref:Uncharacterized protein n=1 Tax=Stephania cephalantha TaxID=152367 RepID=A0AAP0HXZ5_9MAGN
MVVSLQLVLGLGLMLQNVSKSQNFEGNNFQSIQAPSDVSNVAVDMKLALSVTNSSQAVSYVHQADAHSNSNNLKCYKTPKASTALIDNSSGQEKTTSWGLMTSLPFQPDYSLKQNKNIAAADDDIPEYDFGTAYGISHSSQSKSVATSGTALLGMKPTMPHGYIRQQAQTTVSQTLRRFLINWKPIKDCLHKANNGKKNALRPALLWGKASFHSQWDDTPFKRMYTDK